MTKQLLQSPEQHCHFCGRLLDGEAIYIRDGEVYCCEGCYLGNLAYQESQRAHDEVYLLLVESLVAALDAREHETSLHSKRVACHTLVLARRFTDDREQLRQIYWGALLHDIGKLAIPDAILLKPSPLTETEWAVMRSHPQHGYNIVATVPFMQRAAQIVLCHEEHYDGGGYPHGLEGEAIPLDARLFAVIDTLDAITSDRPYRKGMSFEVAKEEIVKQANHQFDPQAVEALLAEEAILREMVSIKCAAKPGLW